MDNLDFGWEFGLMILSIVLIVYLLIVFINYGFILWIGNGLKLVLKRTIWKEKEILSIVNLLIIYLPLALLIQIGINRILVDLLTNDNGQIEFINSYPGSFFIEIVFFYFGSWIGSLEVIGMILLRFKYDKIWNVIKKESWAKRSRKIGFLLMLLLGLRLCFRNFLNYYYIGNLSIYWILWIFQIVIIVGLIYFMLKRWNVVIKSEDS